MAHLNNFTQYYLLRNGRNSPVSLLDSGQMEGLDVMDRQQAAISKWWASNGMAVTSRSEYMEALPSQAIRLDNQSNAYAFRGIDLAAQSKEGFKKFHLKGT
jgi:hypothetical protein